MAQHVSQLPYWHLPMPHSVPAACASLMRGTAVRAPLGRADARTQLLGRR